MKIGIFTFARVCNYGAVLQAYALKTSLERMGNSVEVVDHSPVRLRIGDWPLPVPVLSRHPSVLIRNVMSWIKHLPGQLWHLGLRIRRSGSFSSFRFRYLNLSRPVRGRSVRAYPYDVAIVGSDQVWNIGLTSGMDPFYWGTAFPAGVRCLAYGVSAGGSLRHVAASARCRRAIHRFDAVGVREQELKDAMLSDLPDDSPVVVDPVFLLSVDEWRSIECRPGWVGEEPFAILYRVADSEPARRTAESWARSRNLRMVELCIGENYPRKANEVYGIPPGEVIWLFDHATVVVAASFHGTALSLLFRKPFLAFGTGAPGDGRLKNLLELVGASDNFHVKDCTDYPAEPVSEDGRLSDVRQASLVFLKRALTP